MVEGQQGGGTTGWGTAGWGTAGLGTVGWMVDRQQGGWWGIARWKVENTRVKGRDSRVGAVGWRDSKVEGGGHQG